MAVRLVATLTLREKKKLFKLDMLFETALYLSV